MAGRLVKCQVCTWAGMRTYGLNGILCEPCPDGHRVTYHAPQEGDAVVTPDNGTIRNPKPQRAPMSQEHKEKLLAGLQAAREAKRKDHGTVSS